MGGASLAQSFDELRCFDARLMLKDGILRSMLARASKVGMAHAFRYLKNLRPLNARCIEQGEPSTHDVFGNAWRG
jgi:hypothetical protein